MVIGVLVILRCLSAESFRHSPVPQQNQFEFWWTATNIRGCSSGQFRCLNMYLK
jgi:hypothetical protein